MDTPTKLTLAPTLIALPLLFAALLLAVGALRGWRLPLIATDRGALIAFCLLCLAACAVAGPWLSFSTLGLGHWTTIAGILLGLSVLAVLLSAFSGFWLPGIASHRAALLALTGLVSLKALVGLARYVG